MKKTIVITLSIITQWIVASASSLSPSTTLFYKSPAKYFEEALVIGNGTMGGIVYGGTDTDKISLNDITLWTGEPCNMNIYSPDAYKAIPDIREALKNGQYQLADSLQRIVQGHFTQNYQPLGQLQIEYLEASDESDREVTDYIRHLDISKAVAQTSYKRGGYLYQTEYFVSNPDSGMVIKIHTDNPQGLKARISLTCQLRNNIYVKDGCIYNDGYAGYASMPNYYDSDEKFYYDDKRGIHFRTIVKVVRNDQTPVSEAVPSNNQAPVSEATTHDNHADMNSIVVEGSHDITIYIVNATSFNGFDKDPVKEGCDYKTLANNRLRQLTKPSVEEVKSRHIADYKNIYDRVKLTLGTSDTTNVGFSMYEASPTDEQLLEYVNEDIFNPDLETLYFNYGRYLLISSSRTPNVPANLQGLWNEHLLPPWSCNYTANINLEENYWPAETTAMPEMHNSLFTFMGELLKSGQQTAKHYYGIDKGWCLAHNTDIWAMTCPVGLHTGDPNWANWNMGGAWISTHIWEHYSFSLDKDFLRLFYPQLKGAAEFCMAWLVDTNSMGIKGKNYLITAPCTSPENIYVTPDGYHGRTAFGGFADMAMIRECVTDARNAAIILGDSEFEQRASKTLTQLQPYKIGKKGNLQEWFYDWKDEDPHHRHQSHLFGVYPGHCLDDGVNDRKKLLKAAAKTLKLKGDQTTGWSTGWRVNLYARLHDAKNAYHIYRKLLNYISPDGYVGTDKRSGGGTYPNLLDAHQPFQIDGNFGGCAGVAEMLLQSSITVADKDTEECSKGTESYTIELLPALPRNWKDGEVTGLRARGGYSVDIKWRNGKVVDYKLHSNNPGKVTVKYNGKTNVSYQ